MELILVCFTKTFQGHKNYIQNAVLLENVLKLKLPPESTSSPLGPPAETCAAKQEDDIC